MQKGVFIQDILNFNYMQKGVFIQVLKLITYKREFFVKSYKLKINSIFESIYIYCIS